MVNSMTWTARKNLLLGLGIPFVSGSIAAALDMFGLRFIGALVFVGSFLIALKSLFSSVLFCCPRCSSSWPLGFRSKCNNCQISYGSDERTFRN